jgi:hypothetical protein
MRILVEALGFSPANDAVRNIWALAPAAAKGKSIRALVHHAEAWCFHPERLRIEIQ